VTLRLPALLLCAALAFAPAAAHAQFSVQDQQTTEADARRVADDFGACVAASYAAAARRIVLDPVPHDEIFSRYRTTISGLCMNESDVSGPPSQLRFPYPTLHAVLADNLVRREFRDSGPTDLATAPAVAPIEPPPLPDVVAMAGMDERERAAIVATHASDDAWLVLQRIGLCTARRAPETVRQALMTRVGSDEERAAMRGLGAEIGGCVPTGSTVRLRRAELRWAVALGYYRLAMAQRAGATDGAGGGG
jgi:hypothetical protein